MNDNCQLPFVFSSSFAETSGESPGELADITWSSSGSDFSDEDKALPQLQRDGGHGCGADRFCSRTASCPEDGATEGKFLASVKYWGQQ